MVSLTRIQRTKCPIQRMSLVLISAFRLTENDKWLWKLGQGNESTLQQVIENWIRTFIVQPDPQLVDVIFPMLYQRFESFYYEQEAGK
ncbi:MAG: hypothetical protein C0631_02885 [Sedimenticola sp.]|nr:MAG: hypothetical protein C0631_02885 [Sedimenticola sp.]